MGGHDRKARAGQWVQIRRVVLPPGQRAPQVPPDTQAVPLELRAKGFLVEDAAAIGKEVTIRTYTGRTLRGELVAINPAYGHDFGEPVPELLAIGLELRARLDRLREEDGDA